MAIKKDITVTVENKKSIMSHDVWIYQEDKNIDIYFTIIDTRFEFSTVTPQRYNFTIRKPDGDLLPTTEITPLVDNKVKFTITEQMADEFSEIGMYDILIHLYDDLDSRISIPEIAFEVKQPLMTTNVLTNSGFVQSAILDGINEKLDRLDDDGNYIKTVWNKGDLITEENLNKIENQLSDLDKNRIDIGTELEGKANKTDLTNDRIFKGSDTTANILNKTGSNGEYYYSTDGKCYYLKSENGWINIGYGDNKINSIVDVVDSVSENGKYLSFDGSIKSGANAFKISTLNVEWLERYEISGRCRDWQRLVCFYDENDIKISIFPNSSNGLPSALYTNTFDIPKGVKKIVVSSYEDKIKICKLPSLILPKGINEVKNDISDINNKVVNIGLMEQKFTLEQLNKYVGHTGTIATIQNGSFNFAELSVNENERFKIKGSCIDWQRLYSIIDKNNNVIKVFPNINNALSKTSYEEIVTIPIGGVKLNISSYLDFDDNCVKLPIMNLLSKEIEVEDYTYCKHLLNKVLTIGDSLTEGAYYSPLSNGKPIKENYPYYLSKLNDWEVANSGKSGYSASEWYNLIRPNYNFANYDTFVIWLGTNEGYTDTLEEDTAFDNYNNYANTQTGYYCKIIESILEVKSNANIFMLNIYASKTNVTTSNLVLGKIATKYNLPLFNMNDGTVYRGENHDLLHPFGNTVHFGKVGNLFVAKKVSNYIKEYIRNNLAYFEKINLT